MEISWITISKSQHPISAYIATWIYITVQSITTLKHNINKVDFQFITLNVISLKIIHYQSMISSYRNVAMFTLIPLFLRFFSNKGKSVRFYEVLLTAISFLKTTASDRITFISFQLRLFPKWRHIILLPVTLFEQSSNQSVSCLLGLWIKLFYLITCSDQLDSFSKAAFGDLWKCT